MNEEKPRGRIRCPVCDKDAPSVGLCPHCGCYTDCRTNPTEPKTIVFSCDCRTKEVASCDMPDWPWVPSCSMVCTECHGAIEVKIVDSIEICEGIDL